MLFTPFVVPFLALFICAPTSNGLQLIPSHLQNELGDALEAIFSMGVKVETLLNANSSQPQNFLVSPLSLTLLLGQLMVGAEGKFQEHLYDLVTLSKVGDATRNADMYMRLHKQLGTLVRLLQSKPDRHFTLNSHNALFYNRHIKLRRQFEYDSELFYHTKFFPLNFKRPQDAMSTINNWAIEHTNGLIRNIAPTPPGMDTAAIFANAIYFYGKWQQPFSSELNHLGPFQTTRDSQAQVTYMVNFLEQVPYAESKRLNCKLLVLPYENNELGMYVILPNAGDPHEFDISAFASRAKIADYLQLLGDLKMHDVNVKIPKFTMTSSLSLLQPLQMYATYKKYMQNRQVPALERRKATNVLDELEDKQAMFESFKSNYRNSSHADEIILSAAKERGNLAVSDVLQHMTFSLNEIGTEAAAVTAGIVDYSGGSKTFLANKPFMFFIRHEATAATLFWGTISNP